MPTLDQALDIVSQLSIEQQTMLIEILQRRQTEARRVEIAANAQQAVTAFQQGQLTPQSATEVIAELRRSLSDEADA